MLQDSHKYEMVISGHCRTGTESTLVLEPSLIRNKSAVREAAEDLLFTKTCHGAWQDQLPLG